MGSAPERAVGCFLNGAAHTGQAAGEGGREYVDEEKLAVWCAEVCAERENFDDFSEFDAHD